MLVNPSRQRNLLSYISACWLSQLYLRHIGLYGDNSPATGCRSDVDEEQFTLGEFLYFCLFFVVGFNSEKTTEKEKVDFEF
jgi:hypothetical protein